MFCDTSASSFEDSNLAKNMVRGVGLLQSEKNARIGSREMKGTVSIATVELRPLAPGLSIRVSSR